ncbi:MAG: helix-hairpin-helix domain-containing protein [Ignavibacteriaceae bacterium]|nr:helix-hairpin-helix domain-containing protein [Ignavibacteriaceae bacterium]
MKKLFIPVTLLFLSGLGYTFAQTDTSSTDIEESLETVLEETTDESDNNFLYDEFENLARHPINLNTCTAEELIQIPILDLPDAALIIEHRKKFGMFISSSELFSVENLNSDKVQKLLPFVFAEQSSFKEEKKTIPSVSFLHDLNFEYRSRIISDLQPRAGFLDNAYQGNKIKFYNRGIFELDNTYRLSFLTEKDAGEKSLNDFTSFSLSAKKLGNFSSLVVGDYIVEFGHGLALWSPYAPSKSSDIGFVTRQRDKNIIPYKSTDENNFFRGAAIQYDLYPFNFSLYASNNFFDASIDSVRNIISSIPIDGYHRTEIEYTKKNTAREQFLGGRIDYDVSNALQVSGLYYSSTYSLPIETSSSAVSAKGKTFAHYSIAYSYLPADKAGEQSSFIASGEFSFNGISVAQLHSLQKTFSRNFSYVFSVRSYPRNYYSLHGRAFAENPYDLQNEIGLYNGILFSTSFGKISFYYDQFMFPAGTGSTPLSSKGNEVLLNVVSRISKNIETTLRYKNEKKDVVITGKEVKEFTERFRQQVRFETTFPVSSKLYLKNRIEYNSYSLKKDSFNEKGWLFFQDVKYKIEGDLSLYGRIIFFKTDSFNSAIYEFENDLPGIMSNLAMYGEGFRCYLLVKVKLLNRLAVSFKYSETTKPKEKTLSSGTSEIFTNVDNNFHLQLELAL